MNPLVKNFFDNNLRAEHIIHIALQCCDDKSWPSSVRDVFAEDFADIAEAMDIDFVDYAYYEDASFEELSLYFIKHGLAGFLIKFATPVPQNIDGDQYECYWNYYQCKWIYAESYDEVCQKALAWKKQYITNALELCK